MEKTQRRSSRITTKNEKKKASNWTWNTKEELDGIVWGKTKNFEGAQRIAAFDMDYTLITPKRGKGLPQGPNDWKFLTPKIGEKLKEVSDQGYAVVIFSNQKGISKGKTSSDVICQKIENFTKGFDFPLAALFATQDDYHRKPGRGMWDYFVKNLNDGEEVELEGSFYIGDAAGRPKTKTHRKDFSDGDRYFALSVGIAFRTPEDYFLNIKETLPPVKPSLYDRLHQNTQLFEGEEYTFNSKNKDMIVFIGSPGSGKSTFYNNYCKGYARVNNDSQKSKKKTLEAFMKGASKGTGIVIDNTNRDRKQRSRWIELATKHGYKKIAFRFLMDKPLAMDFNKLRRINRLRKHNSDKVPDMVIHSFFKYLEEPGDDEFDEVYHINPVLNFISDEEKEFLKKSF